MKITSPLASIVLLSAVPGTFAALSPRLAQLRNQAEKTEHSTTPQSNHVEKRHRRTNNHDIEALPAQTFYVPFPEDNLLHDTFMNIIPFASGPVHSLVALSVSTSDTVIWVDHQEDGYEDDVTHPTQASTVIWGDHNAANGCAPNVVPCTDAADHFVAGDSIVLDNTVDTDNMGAVITYGGGDKIQASFPVAMTRGSFPESPGAFLAGAVEVFDTTYWGTIFETPLAQNSPSETSAFEHVGVYIQAYEDDTSITYPDGTVATLNEGETGFFRVLVTGESFTATAPIQAFLVTGDEVSFYEVRWYSLRPKESWSTEYFNPVGNDSRYGGTKVICYNPKNSDIVVTYEYLKGGNANMKMTKQLTVPAKANAWTENIPRGSASKLYSSDVFIAYGIVDVVAHGQVYDWGFPLMPAEDLTPIVLIGWGYGCAELDCSSNDAALDGKSRSVVWVTPTEDSDIYCDLDNDGVFDRKKASKALMSKIFKDNADDDMSGAVIWATRSGEGPEGTMVPLAAAWGQDPTLSTNDDNRALDMGTMVVPFGAISASKGAALEEDNHLDAGGQYEGVISHGDLISYTIIVTNVGQIDLPTGSVLITDNLDPMVEYIPDSTEYWCPDSGTYAVADLAGPDPYPLVAGVANFHNLPKRGGQHTISFLVRIKQGPIMDGIDKLINSGVASAYGMVAPFQNKIPLQPQRSWSEQPSPGPTGNTSPPTRSPTPGPTSPPTRSPTPGPTLRPTKVPTPTPSESPTDWGLGPSLYPTEPEEDICDEDELEL